MWDCVAVMAVSIVKQNEFARDLMSARPGGIVRMNPRDIQFLPQAKPKADCEGCGAPLKTHIHHCEYCRRAK